jgi:hypothetical protein
MRTIKKLSVLGVIVFLLCSVGGVAAQSGVDPGTGKANIFLQNISQTGQSADIALEYTRQQGVTVAPASFTESITGLGPGAAKYLLYTNGWQEPPPATTVPDGWAGSVLVSSSQPLAAIVNLFWDGTTSAATYPGVDSVSHDIYLPNLLVRSGRLTRVYIQNAESSQCTDVTLKYYNRDGALKKTSTKTIPANAQITLDLSVENPDFSATAGTGSMHIHSDSCNLAAVASIHYPSRDTGGSAAYRGFTGGETKVWFPSEFRRQSGSAWSLYNATIVQNLGSIDAQVIVHFIGKGSSVTKTVNDTIKAKASNGYNMITQGTASSAVWAIIQSLGTNWVGTIMVESTNAQPLAGVGLYFSLSNVPDVMGYESIGDSTASNKLYSPAVYRKYIGASSDQWSATLVQNLAATAVNIGVDFFNSDGSHATGPYTVNVPGNSSVGLNLHSGVDLPAAALTALGTTYSGGMVITAPAGSKLIGVTNIFYESKVTPAVSREQGAAYPLFPAPAP